MATCQTRFDKDLQGDIIYSLVITAVAESIKEGDPDGFEQRGGVFTKRNKNRH